ncbi:MAG: Phytochrome-like protein cph2 [Candidatus Izimaplasma bacterium HR2]|nr:MAG: Phytochrome-like protein cph2 [Candidatus Izimaplasma bacterium HR2]
MKIFERIRENKGFSIILLFSTFFWVFSIVLFIVTNNTAKSELINVESSRALTHYELVLHNIIDNLDKIEVFTTTVGVSELSQDKFDQFTETNSFEGIGFISLSIAPEGVIEYYYVEEYDESLIGLDLVNDERAHVREAVEYSIENDVIVINGPFVLIQGGNGLVFRKAVFEAGEFVAIINLVVQYETLNAQFYNTSSDVVDLGIYDKDNNLIFGELEYEENLDFYQKIQLDNIDWNVGVKVSRDYRISSLLINVTIVSLSSTLYIFAIILGSRFYRSNKELISNQKKLIHFDNLTGLPNRRLLINDINTAIRNEKPFYLGFGDLDNFKNLNDILGHSVGDKYLQDISERFIGIISDILNVYRWGGDEFIFMFNTQNKNDTINLLASIYDIFKEPIIIKETNYNVSISIGVVRYPDHGDTIDDLVKRADIVMYDIKSHNRNTFGFFEDEYLDNLQREVDFENKLNEYELEDFQVYLQPLVKTNTNEIIGFEALSRLFDRNSELINTSEVVKVYERKGDIFKLDKYIVEQTCKYSVKLKKEFKKDFTFSFNISPITLSNEYIEFLELMIEKYKINPIYFVIEIIETTGFKDINESVRLLNKLRGLGFRIAMDDFGMGFSSLSYITRLPLSLIKIDRNFIQNYQSNKFDKMLILTIRDISKSLDIEIVVEGIETEEQLDFIKEIGAHYYQGYLHSKPMNIERLINFLQEIEVK